MPHLKYLFQWETEARQHKRNKDVVSDACFSCCCRPWTGAELGNLLPILANFCFEATSIGPKAKPFLDARSDNLIRHENPNTRRQS